MPLYGVAQAGSNATSPGLNLTSILPGQSFTLFNGEAGSANPSSVAFSNAMSPVQISDPIQFTISWDAISSGGTTVNIQGANQDLDAQYQTLFQSVNMTLDKYTDTGNFRYYRATVSGYANGGNVTVIAQH